MQTNNKGETIPMSKKTKANTRITSDHNKNMIQGIPEVPDGSGIPGRETK